MVATVINTVHNTTGLIGQFSLIGLLKANCIVAPAWVFLYYMLRCAINIDYLDDKKKRFKITMIISGIISVVSLFITT